MEGKQSRAETGVSTMHERAACGKEPQWIRLGETLSNNGAPWKTGDWLNRLRGRLDWFSEKELWGVSFAEVDS
jgi:hypothetical protein